MVSVSNIKEWILSNGILGQAKREEWSYEDLYDWLFDELWNYDSITGNGCYWYASEDKCSEYLSNNFDILYDAMSEFYMDDQINTLIKHYENKDLARYFDCTIRCYLLGECIEKALEELHYEVG